MEEVLKKLLQVMEKEAEIIRALIECGRLKQEYVIADNIQELDRLLARENILVLSLNKYEEERVKLQENLAVYWQMRGEELGALKLLEQVKVSFPFFYPAFAEVIDELTASISFLQYLNRHNNELIEQALQYIETVQAMLEGDSPGVYDKNVRPAETAFKRINLIDKKV